MTLPVLLLWALLVLGVAALCVMAWRSWRLDKVARMMLGTWQIMVTANARKAEIEHEREQQKLHLESLTMTERAELERVELARKRAVEYNALQEELNQKGHEILKEFQDIGQKLTETIPARHPATVQPPDRPRPPISAIPGNGGDYRKEPGQHRKEPDPAEATPSN